MCSLLLCFQYENTVQYSVLSFYNVACFCLRFVFLVSLIFVDSVKLARARAFFLLAAVVQCDVVACCLVFVVELLANAMTML